MKNIYAVKFDAIDVGLGRQVDQCVEINGRLRVRPLADQPRPHGIVQFWKIIRAGHRLSLDIIFVSPC